MLDAVCSVRADAEAAERLVNSRYPLTERHGEQGLVSGLLAEKKQSWRDAKARAGWARLGGAVVARRSIGHAKATAMHLAMRPVPSRAASPVFHDFACADGLWPPPTPPGSNRTAAPRPLSPTAYLDGVRGVAALIVYVFHWGYLWFPFLRRGWHSSSASGVSETDDLFLQLPVVRALHSGRASVTVFFVVSGYVLAVKTLARIHQGQSDRALDSLAGSLFRRPFRLYLPIVVATFINLVLVRCGAGVFQKDPTGSGGPPRGKTWREQLRHWSAHTVHLVNPFRNINGRANLYSPPYNGHLWTIPIEFKGSLLVFVLLLAFIKARRWLHMGVTLGFACWLAQLGDLDMALFCSGLFLAELSIIWPPAGKKNSQDEHTTTTLSRRPRRSLRVGKHLVTSSLLLIALHLLSYPENGGRKSPGFRRLSLSVPAFYKGGEELIQWFWISIGSRQQEPLLQRPFTTDFAQYLGRISYALYLAHGTVIHTIGTRFLNPAWKAWLAAEGRALGLRDTGFNDAADAVLYRSWSMYVYSAFLGTLMSTFVLFWAADVFCRAVDVPMVKLTRTLGNWAWRK
ncbi:uncharacterized protein PG998_001184 [Apiospora kogelbergensis]|uniref:uncharacterized protein n=1 Tax=Apiospora kogelbergensis TaxID=1337665 RepID=UPI00312DD515